MKKLNVKKIEMKKKNVKKNCENHHPTRHIKYKVINFASSNKSVMANKLPSINLEGVLRRIKSTLTRF